jgi:alpha-1,2-glucosyltransferase
VARDPKITTLPGLYLASIIVLQSWNLAASLVDFQLSSVCTVASLRATNLLFAACAALLLNQLLAMLFPTSSLRARLWKMAELALFPVHFFFHFLFYTDTCSTLFVLMCYTLATRGLHKRAALAGVLAVMMRQTNVVWVAFSCACALLFDPGLHLALGKAQTSENAVAFQKPRVESDSPWDAIDSLMQLLAAALAPGRWRRSLAVILPYAAVGLSFLLFVFFNKVR